MNFLKNSSRCLRGVMSNSRTLKTYSISQMSEKKGDAFQSSIHNTDSITLPFYEGTLSFDKSAFSNQKNGAKLLAKINFSERSMKNRLSIKVFECPKLLKENFMRHVPGPLAEFLHASLIKLSYEDYLDKKRGRKQCIETYNVLNRTLNDKLPFACFSSNENFEEDRIMFMYNSPEFFDGSQTNPSSIYANIQHLGDTIYISKEKETNSVGLIYALSVKPVTAESISTIIGSVCYDEM